MQASKSPKSAASTSFFLVIGPIQLPIKFGAEMFFSIDFQNWWTHHAILASSNGIRTAHFSGA